MEFDPASQWELDIYASLRRGIGGFVEDNPETGEARLMFAYDRAWGIIHDELFPIDHEEALVDPKTQILEAFKRLWKLRSDDTAFKNVSFAFMADFSDKTKMPFDTSSSHAQKEILRKLTTVCQGVTVPETYGNPDVLALGLINFAEVVFVAWFVALPSQLREMTEDHAQLGISDILNGITPGPYSV